MRRDFWYDSHGVGKIHGCRWTPEGEPRAVCQIIHGIAEYVERYDSFAEYLCGLGFAVVAEDHMGQGQSVNGGGIRGYFHGGWFTAVDDLSLGIARNSFTGLLGPNGAGKSTTLKMITNLIRPTSGHVFINGYDVTEDPKEALAGVGTVIETPEFYGYMTPRENLRYIGGIIGMSPESISAQTDEVLEKVKMSGWADKRMSTFSKGMRQRIAIGQALLGDPDIVILDEPTSGLDPRGMAEMRAIMKEFRGHARGLTVLTSSHILHEVQDLCDRVAMVNHGRLVFNDDIEAVGSIAGLKTMVLKTEGVPEASVHDRLRSLSSVVTVDSDGADTVVRFRGSRSALFTDIAGLGIGAYSLSEGDSLESKYLEIIKESS